MSTSTEQHRQRAPDSVPCAVVTVSDTRTLATDRGGELVVEMLASAGHVVKSRDIVPDDPGLLVPRIQKLVRCDDVDAVLITGGTGISSRDVTHEAISKLLSKTLPGYGELFRMLSYDQVGSAAMLSRAVGGLVDRTVVLTMPGSTAAVRLAMEQLILPELSHLVYEATK